MSEVIREQEFNPLFPTQNADQQQREPQSEIVQIEGEYKVMAARAGAVEIREATMRLRSRLSRGRSIL